VFRVLPSETTEVEFTISREIETSHYFVQWRPYGKLATPRFEWKQVCLLSECAVNIFNQSKVGVMYL